jgi:uncharacterized membrane protein
MSAPARLRALDWLRGIAVLVMVECHVFNALLAPEYRGSRWFPVLNWLNGFVAPAFLLVSGAVMGINLQKRWEQGTAKLWRRVGQIFVVAYLLHLPTVLLWQFFGARGPHLIDLWTKMDILQCVAGSLTIILLLVPITRSALVHRLACAVLGLLVANGTGFVANWKANGVSLPSWLLNYVWPTGIGKFPLVPWAAFPLIGVTIGPAFFHEPTRGRQSVRASLGGILCIFVAQTMDRSQQYDARFVFERMGWVLVALAGCCWLHEAPRGTKWILQFGELSLWSYTVHLIIVYGSCISLGLDTLLGARWSPLAVLFWLTLVLFVTAVVVRWRSKHPTPWHDLNERVKLLTSCARHE